MMNPDIVSVTATLTREEAMAALSRMMGNASEECYCAGWMSGSEEDIPRVCRRMLKDGYRPAESMWGIIALPEAKLMCALADALGHWINFEGKPYVPECDKATS